MQKRYRILFILSLVALMVIGALFLMDRLTRAESQNRYDDLKENVSPSPSPAPTKAPFQSPVDFDALWEITPEIIGWIRMEGTKIDYPIAYRAEDNSYYLNHDIYGNRVTSASIYAESYNNPDFTDFNTVLYGHNMDDGSMFASLIKMKQTDYFDQHDTITIYLPDQTLTYTVFSARVTDDRHIFSILDNQDVESCKAYLNTIYADDSSTAKRNNAITVTEHDRILTLSTCTNRRKTERFIVSAVLTNTVE